MTDEELIARLREIQGQAGLFASAAADRIESLVQALRFYANPEIYEPHPHGSAFDRRDVSYIAAAALTAGENHNG